jgi:hypothetical protein
LSPALQHRGDLVDRVIDAGLPEDLPRDGAAAEIAECAESSSTSRDFLAATNGYTRR